MANPNIMTITAIVGKTFGVPVSTTKTTLISNVSGSGQLLKLNSVVVSNGETTARNISLALQKTAQVISGVSANISDTQLNGSSYTIVVPMSAGTLLAGSEPSASFTGSNIGGTSVAIGSIVITAGNYVATMTNANTQSWATGSKSDFGWTNPSMSIPLETDIELPGQSSVVLVSKDASMYLEEGDYLVIWSGSNGNLKAMCSFEAIGQKTGNLGII